MGLRGKLNQIKFQYRTKTRSITVDAATPPRIYNYSTSAYRRGSTKRALVSYLTIPVVESLSGIKPNAFSNSGIAVSLVNTLSKLGYAVDIINWDDATYLPSADYDLFVAHGAKNFLQIHNKLGHNTQTVYFSTGSYWRYHNDQEKQRFNYFKQRHHAELPLDRYIFESEETANKAATAIICLGNQQLAATYNDFPAVYNLPVGSFPAKASALKQKDYLSARNRFLFFSGGGNVHKGLDLLLDAFKNTDHQLHIATRLDDKFEKYYHSQLFNSKNIHYEGYVDQNTRQFKRLIATCGYIILPSCSEGSPGSVVDCMQHGLVPILTDQSHLDVGSFGTIFDNDQVETIKQTIKRLGKIEPKKLEAQALAAQHCAQTIHSQTKFEESLYNIFKEITKEQRS